MFELVCFWGIVMLVGIIIEMYLTGMFYAFCFAFGALITTVFAFYSFSFINQLFIFLGASFVALFFIKNYVHKINKIDSHKTNIDTIIGKNGSVVKTPDHTIEYYLVKVDGQIWRAYEIHNQILRVQELVTVIRFSGTKLYVQKNNNHNLKDYNHDH